jgi:flagellar hook protein FlgE
MNQTREADGETARSSFTVFDSLGTPMNVDVTFVKQATVPGGGTEWQFIAESSDTAADDRVVGLGLLEFDANGQFVSASNTSFSIERDNGAASPQTIAMNFNNGSDAIASLTDQQSVVAAGGQDGSPIGTLESFSVGDDGVIAGAFSNGLTRDIGQLALGRFANNDGLIAVANSEFLPGANSGRPIIGPPATLGGGRVIAGALEQSNVDLSQEFVGLIGAQTGFSASSRVINTADEMIQALLTIGR